MTSIRAAILAAAALAALLFAGSAIAGWGGGGTGRGYSKAKSMPAMAAPTVAVSNRDVTVTWSAPSGGAPAAGYVVRRYNTSGDAQTVGSACAGVVSGLSCVESGVPAGSWRYTVRAAQGNWRGAESSQSAVATVEAPSLSLSPGTVTSFPTSLSGGIAHFATGQTVSFRLDDPATGPLLTGSITPSPVPASGSSSASVTIPAGTANGSHTVYAVGSGGDRATAPITVTAPKVTASTIAKSAGGDGGYIKQGGTYYAYANVSGAGSPPAGLAGLTADLSAITTGGSASSLSFGSYTVDGQSYNYRTAQQTAKSVLTAGSKSYTVKLTDAGGTQTQSSYSVTVDNTAPSAADVQAVNGAVGTAGKPELGDQLVLTYSEPIDASSVLASWSGSSTGVVVRLVNGLTDSVQIWDAANTTQLPLGSIDLGRGDYTGATMTFGASGTPSTMVRSGSAVTVTLGTPSVTAGTAAGAGSMTWTPSATATDRAGNATSILLKIESGTIDADF